VFFGSARSVLPGNFAVFATTIAEFAALGPITVAREMLIGRVPPFASLLIFAIAWTAAVDPALFVPAVFVPAEIALFAPFVVTSPKTVATPGLANVPVGRLADSTATAFRHSFVRAGIPAVPIVVCGVSHFVCSNLAGRIGSPIPLRRKLHQRSCRDSSQKHQRVVAHRHFQYTSSAGGLSESTRSPTLEITPTLAPYGRFPSAVES
jgi:hypothetical protein